MTLRSAGRAPRKAWTLPESPSRVERVARPDSIVFRDQAGLVNGDDDPESRPILLSEDGTQPNTRCRTSTSLAGSWRACGSGRRSPSSRMSVSRSSVPRPPNSDMTRARPGMRAAASKSMTRTCGSPALVIRPAMSVLPDWHRRGLSPAHAPKSLMPQKRPGSSTALRKVSVTITSTPGLVLRSRITGSDFARAATHPLPLPNRRQAGAIPVSYPSGGLLNEAVCRTGRIA